MDEFALARTLREMLAAGTIKLHEMTNEQLALVWGLPATDVTGNHIRVWRLWQANINAEIAYRWIQLQRNGM